jgi:hypothetical protein
LETLKMAKWRGEIKKHPPPTINQFGWSLSSPNERMRKHIDVWNADYEGLFGQEVK